MNALQEYKYEPYIKLVSMNICLTSSSQPQSTGLIMVSPKILVVPTNFGHITSINRDIGWFLVRYLLRTPIEVKTNSWSSSRARPPLRCPL